MKNLSGANLFEAMRLIKEAGIREEVKTLADKITDGASVNEVGLELLLTLSEKLSEKKIEHLFWELISKNFEMSPEEVKNLDLFDLLEGLMKIADVDRWKAFLNLATH